MWKKVAAEKVAVAGRAGKGRLFFPGRPGARVGRPGEGQVWAGSAAKFAGILEKAWRRLAAHPVGRRQAWGGSLEKFASEVRGKLGESSSQMSAGRNLVSGTGELKRSSRSEVRRELGEKPGERSSQGGTWNRKAAKIAGNLREKIAGRRGGAAGCAGEGAFPGPGGEGWKGVGGWQVLGEDRGLFVCQVPDLLPRSLLPR